MKKEAVNMRPTDTMTTASVGYHSTGTGLEIAFAACETRIPLGQHSGLPSRTLDLRRRRQSRAHHPARSAAAVVAVRSACLVVSSPCRRRDALTDLRDL